MGANGSKTQLQQKRQQQQQQNATTTFQSTASGTSWSTLSVGGLSSSPMSVPTSSSPLGLLFSGRTMVTNCDAPLAPPPPPLLPGSGTASSPPPPPPVDPSSSSLPPPSTSSPEEDSIAAAAAAATAFINPGPYEHAPQEFKRLLMLDTHDGFRCDINKQISPYMAVVHSFWLGTHQIPDGRNRTYTWLTQVADDKSLYMARVDPDRLSVDGRIHRSILGGLAMCKLQVGVSADGQADQCLLDVDVNGPSWSGNVKYGSMGGAPVYGCSFHQGITPKFSMGGEGMYICANGNMITSYMAKLSIPATGSALDTDASTSNKGQQGSGAGGGPGGPPVETPSSSFLVQLTPQSPAGFPLTLNYKRIVTPNRVTVGAELACDPIMSLASNVMLGAEFKFSRSKLQLVVDGTAKMQTVLETKLGKEPGQPTLTFCAEVDHMKDEMKFGYGLTMDG